MIDVMEENVGRLCFFNTDDGTAIHGTVGGVPNDEHYRVGVQRSGYVWDWYVRRESVHFIDHRDAQGMYGYISGN